MLPTADEATRYRILKYLAEHPHASQRELARELGVSVGKVNYCVRALVEKGLLKIRSFSHASNKLAYIYVLTPKGVEEKINVTYAFLRRKLDEYAALEKEIASLTAEVTHLESNSQRPRR